MLLLPPELTQIQASECLRTLVQKLRALTDAQVVVDAAALSHFDSAALAVLLELRRTSLASGKRFSIHGLPTRLGDLAALYGVAELLSAPTAAPVK